jgi:DNA invertase Pin-like site-specific DNA recombinase
VFREVASGAKIDRAQLRRLLGQLDAGDVLLVTRLDRLARSTRDLLNTLAAITERKAGFRSLGDAWADTTTAHGRLMLTILGGLAEFERDLIRTRTSEGRERAKARGVKLGRKPKLTQHQKREAIRRRDRDGEPVREIARSTTSRTARFPGSRPRTHISFSHSLVLTKKDKAGDTHRPFLEGWEGHPSQIESRLIRPGS